MRFSLNIVRFNCYRVIELSGHRVIRLSGYCVIGFQPFNPSTLKPYNPITLKPYNPNGFTYTEVLITLAVLAILFVPMMQLFSRTLVSSSVTGDTITALNLAKWQMERIKNLDYSTAQFKEIGSAYLPPLEEPPFELNGKKLRIYTDIGAGSEPLRVKVSVFPEGRLKDKPTVELITLLEDTTWIKERK